MSDHLISPLDSLFPFQRKIVESGARFKILNCARQCGKSTIFAFEAAMDCARNAGSRWIALSRGERQVREWLLKAWFYAVSWCDYCKALTGTEIQCSRTSESISFSNGSRITGIPANADTARGYSANLILDEFAYHERANEIWAAVFPFISNEIAGKHKIRIGSTVAGKNNKFWELFSKPSEETGFEKWQVDIYQAKADGFPVDVDALKRAVSDADIWRQEFECVPVEGTTTLVGYDDLRAAQSPNATRELAPGILDNAARRLFVGIDIGRKHDITAIWILERLVTGKFVTRAIRELRHADFAAQQSEILAIVGAHAVKQVCIDATGIGAQLAETARKAFPHKVEECVFSASFKNEIFLGMQTAFQSLSVAIPENDSTTIDDIHAIQKVFTSNGNLLFYAPSNADGHSDRATALALALRAAGKNASRSIRIEPIRAEFPSRRFVRQPGLSSSVMFQDGKAVGITIPPTSTTYLPF